MAYTTRVLIAAKIPSTVLTDALDDDGDGVEDAGAFDNVVAAASQEINGYLAGLFATPFEDPAPAKVAAAAFAFVCEAIYQRRSVTDDKNPYAKSAAWWREHLQAVGNRLQPFDAAVDKAFAPGAAITECLSLNTQST